LKEESRFLIIKFSQRKKMMNQAYPINDLKFGGMGGNDDSLYLLITLCFVVFIEILVLTNFFIENEKLQIANDIFLLLFFSACIFFLWERKQTVTNWYYKFWIFTLFIATIRSPFFNPLLDKKNKWKYCIGGFFILFLSGAPAYLSEYVTGNNVNLFSPTNYSGIALSLLVVILFLSSYG